MEDDAPVLGAGGLRGAFLSHRVQDDDIPWRMIRPRTPDEKQKTERSCESHRGNIVLSNLARCPTMTEDLLVFQILGAVLVGLVFGAMTRVLDWPPIATGLGTAGAYIGLWYV